MKYNFSICFLIIILRSSNTFPCIYKGCRTCEFRSGFCKECGNNYYFKTLEDPICYRTENLDIKMLEACEEWSYDMENGKSFCVRCKSGHYKNYHGTTCIAFTAESTCGLNCETCTVKQGRIINVFGDNSICTYCKSGFNISRFDERNCGEY